MVTIALLLIEPFLLAALLSSSRFKHTAPWAALLALSLPWLLPESWVILRVLAAMVSTLYFLRALELARRSGDLSFHERMWCLTSTFDALGSRPAESRVLARDLVLLAPWAILSVLAWTGLAHTDATILAWGIGLIGFYATVEALTRVTVIGYRAAGHEIPRVQMQPLLARSVSEFWGRRWNRPVGCLLRSFCYLPLARRGHQRLGLAAAFVASAECGDADCSSISVYAICATAQN